MDEQKIHIDNLYREKHGEFAGAPPPNVWDTLESRLDNSPKDRSFSFRWIWYVLIIVVALFLIYFIGKGIKNEGVQEPGKEQSIGLQPVSQKQTTGPDQEPETATTSRTTDGGSLASATSDQTAGTDRHRRNNSLEGSSGSTISREEKELRRGHDGNRHANSAPQNKQHTGTDNTAAKQSISGGSGNSDDQQGNHTTSTESVVTGAIDSLMKSGSQFNAPVASRDEKQQTPPAVKQVGQHLPDRKASKGAQRKETYALNKSRDTTGHFAINNSGNVSKQTPADSQTPAIIKAGGSSAAAPSTYAKVKEDNKPSGADRSTTTVSTIRPIAPVSLTNSPQSQGDAGTTTGSDKKKTAITVAPSSAKPASEGVTIAKQKSPEITSENVPADVAKATATKPARKNAKKEKLSAKGKDGPDNQTPVPAGSASSAKTASTDNGSTGPSSDSPVKMDSPPSPTKGEGAGQDPMIKRKTPFSSWEFGLKAGYEFGLQTVKVNKFIAGPYAAYNISPRVSVAIQPSIKSGKLKNQVLSKDQAYVNTNGITTDTILIFMGGFVQQAYVFQQSYDSMVVSHKMGGSMLEAEIPVTLRYRLSDHFTVFGGFTLSFGKILQVTETKDIHQGLVLIDTFISNSPAQPLPDTSTIFIHTSPPFSAFNNSAYQNPQSNPMRLGFLAGICYSQRRFLVELSLQQNISRLTNVPNADIRSIYTQPYIRILAGYRFK